MPDNLKSLYQAHLKETVNRYTSAAGDQNKNGILIAAGSLKTAFLDDFTYPFKVNPHFKNLVPVTDVPESFVLLRMGEKPKLLFHQPADYWHKTPETPEGFWVDEWDIVSIAEPSDAHNHLGDAENLVFVGEETDMADAFSISSINPEEILNPIHFERAFKTDYELACLAEASKLAALGHIAAKQAFENGDSEFQIQQAYLAATAHREKETPYSNIIALNEHCAILHYQFYEHMRADSEERYSMLIDAGASYHGYAADVTRTYSAKPGLFSDLIAAMNEAQLAIIDDIQVNLNYVELHTKMHYRLAQVLKDFALVDMSFDAMVESNLTFTFLPHGLGHLLGLQTHDVGGFQQNQSGVTNPAPEKYPALRLVRPIQNRQVFTIEPGLYFIPMLLNELRNSDLGKAVNWSLIEDLLPYGGIRIEDNIAVLDGKPVNLTRQAFEAIS
jgi:Xaa-Pro dipeptidase